MSFSDEKKPKNSSTLDELVEQGWQSMQEGTFTRASEIFRAVLAQDAHHREAVFQLARCAYALGQYETAATYATRSIALEPNAPMAHEMFYIRGWGRFLAGESAEALKDANQALARNQGDCHSNYLRAIVLDSMELLHQALASYDAAARLEPSATYLIARARALTRLGNDAEAVVAVERALRNTKEMHAEAYAVLANAQASLGQYERAFEHAGLAIQHGHDSEQLRTFRACLAEQLGRWRTAVEDWLHVYQHQQAENDGSWALERIENIGETLRIPLGMYLDLYSHRVMSESELLDIVATTLEEKR